MAGKEVSGIRAADAGLFRDCLYCLAPGLRASDRAVERVVALAKEVGAWPKFFDPAEHDSFVAAISHLPAVLATSLVNTVSRQGSWPEMAELAAGGFRLLLRRSVASPARVAGLEWA